MANEHMKRCLIQLLIWETDIKTTVKYTTYSPAWLKLESLTISSVGEFMENRTGYIAGGHVNWFNHFEKLLGS